MTPRLPRVFLLLFPALAGCGSAAGDMVTLRVLHWAGEAEVTAEQRIADGFTRRHPNTRVIVESVTTNFGEKLATAIASGAPPDVFLLDSPDIPALVERGLVLDLAPYVQRVGYDPGRVFPQVLEVFRRGDRLFALPKDFTPMVVYYNRDVFDAFDVAYPPAGGWTWEEFTDTARRLTADTDGDGRTDIFGFHHPRRLFEWIPIVWSGGGDILDSSGTRARGFLDGPNTLSAFSFLTSLVTRWQVSPASQFLRTGDPMRGARFYSGSQAMLLSGHWTLPQLLKYAERGAMRIGVAPIPHRSGHARRGVVYASGYAVPVNVRHKRLAVELAAFLSSEQALRARAVVRIGIPALEDLAQELAARDTTGLEAIFLQLVEDARMPWGAVVRDFHEVEELATEVMDRHLLQGEPLAEAAQDVARRIDELRAR